jgi:hypothetical protein
MKEIWKDIDLINYGGEDYTGLYKISNLGRVKSLVGFNGCIKKYFKRELILIPRISHLYYAVNLSKNKKRKTYTIHRLVTIAFIPNPKNKPQVNHIDGNKLNNKVDNLEWCTRIENSRHAWRMGLCENVRQKTLERASDTFKKYNATIKKPVIQLLDGVVIDKHPSAWDAELKTGITNANIGKVAKGQRNKAGGYEWRFANANT